ncbi:Glycine betaine/proline/ectoine/pipecolic acid transporter OusA [Pseudomonas extremaustralis]|uniref:Glycine betaine/proline/ectoine/pipecolic acid transporter OusA n=1 Tax=Pseudomonas extremaustralis TaxID=359110 RepID=A0A5M9J1B3_9PSED|nr:MFS transporter [Pseudomonas extremaustralis]KAA8562828.1 Glycine betaine/proline/ectoine/pipecolic acid transporter OusA [Pseudomonas extremaustralis]
MATQQHNPARQRRRAFIGATSGHLIEWYDYGVYGFLAVYIGQAFFVSDDPATSLLSSFAAFALSFFIRPLGGLFFGPLADKIGRRKTLITVLFMMAGSTCLLGLLPTYASIGIAAPILLVLIRCVQGFSAGGEIGTITSFISEYAGPGRRGFSTCWLMVTAVLGLVLGGAVANGMTWVLGAETMQAGGWRIPFLIAGPMGLISMYIRLKLEDSPEFLALQKAGETSKAPLREVWQWKRAIALVFFIITLHSSIFYLVLTFASTYMSRILKFDSGTTLLYVFIASLSAALVMPLGGIFTDKYGRKPFLMVVGVLATLAMYWFFKSAPTATPASFFLPLMAVAITFGLYASSTYATMSELLPTRIRSTGIAVAYNIPVAVFGGSAPFISTWLIQQTGDITSPWYFYIGTGVISLIALTALRKKDFVACSGMVEPRLEASTTASTQPVHP